MEAVTPIFSSSDAHYSIIRLLVKKYSEVNRSELGIPFTFMAIYLAYFIFKRKVLLW